MVFDLSPADVGLIRETDSEVVFGNSSFVAVLFSLFGFGLLCLSLTGKLSKDGTPRYLAIGFSFVFLILSIGGIFWRQRITMNLSRRTYRRIQGFWPRLYVREGPLEEIGGVDLHCEERTMDGRDPQTYTVWVVGLPFPGEQNPVSIYESQNEAHAYQHLEFFAKKLRLDAIDRTGELVQRSKWDALDLPLVSPPLESERVSLDPPKPPFPLDDQFQIDGQPGRLRIRLPWRGPTLHSMIAAIAAACFVGGIGPALPDNWSVSLYGLLAGSGLVAVWLAVVFTREVVLEGPGGIGVGRSVLGIPLGRTWLPKKDIEEIGFRPAPANFTPFTIRIAGYPIYSRHPAPRRDLFLRTDRTILRIGRGLTPAAQDWLREALLKMLSE